MLSRKARKVELKSAILKGIYEENMGMPHGRPSAARHGWAALDRKWRYRAGLVLVCTVVASLLVALEAGRSPEWVPEARLSYDIAAGTQSADPSRPVAFAPQDHLNELLSGWDATGGGDLIHAPPGRYLDYRLLLSGEDCRLTSIFGLDVRTIVIDPGHGGHDPGAIGANGTQEKDVTLDIALRLRDRLSRSGRYRVLLTRDRDCSVSLAERVKFANSAHADIFVSLHVNSLPQRPLNVIETYYFGPPADAETMSLAEQENKGSEFPINDFRTVIQKIGDTLKRQESVQLAWSIQRSLFTNIQKYDRDVRDVGVKIAPFIVLLGVDSPSVLAEISCITNDEEERKLNTPEYRERVASFLEEGLITYLARRQMHVRGEDEHGPEIGG